MQLTPSSKKSDFRQRLPKRMISFGLLLLLLLVFLYQQFMNFDGMGLSDGFSHPLTGWDHLITMLAVGIWAAQLRGQAIWMLPLAFVGVMSLGGIVGASGITIPSSEGLILLSAAVFSVLIGRKMRFSAKINLLIVAFFAFFHGFAHGNEISTSASLLSYTLGFMLATLLLHGAGILVAKLIVFCMSCLLTLIFSNMAIAQNAEHIINDHVKTFAFTEDLNSVYANTSGNAHLRDSKDNPFSFFQQTLDVICLSESAEAGLMADFTGSGRNRSVACVDKIKTPSKCGLKVLNKYTNNQGLMLKQPDFQALDPIDYPHTKLVHISIYNLDFKHCFPEINHTPGKHLLSNGVGLTSPPSPSIPHNVHPRRKPRSPDIEGSRLQLIFAQLENANVSKNTLKANSDDHAIANSSYTVHCPLAVSQQHNCKSILATSYDLEAKHAWHMQLATISSLHVTRASQNQALLSAMFANHPIPAFH
jgi:urease accessory protein